MSWDLQKKVIIELMRRIKPQGRFVMLEGSEKGVQELNELRSFFGLDPIDVKWHNKFFNDEKLIYFMGKHGFEIIEHNGFGIYFLLTRGLRPYFDKRSLLGLRIQQDSCQTKIMESFKIR